MGIGGFVWLVCSVSCCVGGSIVTHDNFSAVVFSVGIGGYVWICLLLGRYCDALSFLVLLLFYLIFLV